MSTIAVEICIDSVEGALAAQAGGANRVELCDNLVEGGTTPSSGMIRTVRKQLSIALNVIIRPRGGDFCYTDHEFAVMQADVEQAKALGADGVVIGLLHPDGRVDVERTAQLVTLARPLSVTFHRAFDMSVDPHQALAELMALGMDRVLTSGAAADAAAGLGLIAALVKQAAGKIVIMAGGGVNAENARQIVADSGVREIHLSARSPIHSPMRYRNERIYMGLPGLPEYERKTTDVALVRRTVQAVNAGS